MAQVIMGGVTTYRIPTSRSKKRAKMSEDGGGAQVRMSTVYIRLGNR